MLETKMASTSSNAHSVCTPSQALEVYIASAGLIYLALERLKVNYPDMDEVKLYTLLTDQSIQSQLEERTRAQLTLQTYQAANEALLAAKSAIGSMEPFEKAKAATALLNQYAELTKKTEPININAIIWENILPAEAASAVRYLVDSNKPISSAQDIIEHTE